MKKGGLLKAAGVLATVVTLYRGVVLEVPLLDSIIIIVLAVFFFALAKEMKEKEAQVEGNEGCVSPRALESLLRTGCHPTQPAAEVEE